MYLAHVEKTGVGACKAQVTYGHNAPADAAQPSRQVTQRHGRVILCFLLSEPDLLPTPTRCAPAQLLRVRQSAAPPQPGHRGQQAPTAPDRAARAAPAPLPARPERAPACPSALAVAPQPISARGAGRAGAGAGRARPWRT